MKVYKTNHLPSMWEGTYAGRKINVTFSNGVLTVRCGANVLASKDLGVASSVLDTAEMKIWLGYLLSTTQKNENCNN
jgi:hypothetical protein